MSLSAPPSVEDPVVVDFGAMHDLQPKHSFHGFVEKGRQATKHFADLLR